MISILYTQIINLELYDGSYIKKPETSLNKQDIKIIRNSEEITNPGNTAELFNSYFCTIPEELLKKRGNKMPDLEKYHLQIKKSTKTMFFFPVTESEIKKVVKGLKNKVSAGIDEILYYVVKQCIKLLKKRLANIYNALLELEIFPDQIKIAKVAPFYKKRG
jgi:hypothetical protein